MQNTTTALELYGSSKKRRMAEKIGPHEDAKRRRKEFETDSVWNVNYPSFNNTFFRRNKDFFNKEGTQIIVYSG